MMRSGASPTQRTRQGESCPLSAPDRARVADEVAAENLGDAAFAVTAGGQEARELAELIGAA